MQQFISSHATILVAMLGVSLGACLAIILMLRRKQQWHQRSITAMRELQDIDRCYAVDSVAANCIHDLNNLFLVLSMEISRLQEQARVNSDLSGSIETLEELLAQGRAPVGDIERHRYAGNGAQDSCEFLREIGIAMDLANLAGLARIDMTQTPDSTGGLQLARAAHDVHLLVISMARAVAAKGDRVVMRVVAGIAGEPSNDDEQEWVTLFAVPETPGRMDGDPALRRSVGQLAQRMSGSCSAEDIALDLAVSLPVYRN